MLSLQDCSLVNENVIFIALRYVFFTCVTNEQLASPIAIKLIVSKVRSVCSLYYAAPMRSQQLEFCSLTSNEDELAELLRVLEREDFTLPTWRIQRRHFKIDPSTEVDFKLHTSDWPWSCSIVCSLMKLSDSSSLIRFLHSPSSLLCNEKVNHYMTVPGF